MDNDNVYAIESFDGMEIGDILRLWEENHQNRVLAEAREEKIREKIKIFLKERKWNKYEDADTKISISITRSRRESFDKNELKMILTNSQYQSCIRVTEFEVLGITTESMRKKLNVFVAKRFGR